MYIIYMSILGTEVFVGAVLFHKKTGGGKSFSNHRMRQESSKFSESGLFSCAFETSKHYFNLKRNLTNRCN